MISDDEDDAGDDGGEDGEVNESNVAYWNAERGFGYIKDPDWEMTNGDDIFFHISELSSVCHPSEGDKVQFYVWYNEAKERNEAYSVITEESEYWVDN